MCRDSFLLFSTGSSSKTGVETSSASADCLDCFRFLLDFGSNIKNTSELDGGDLTSSKMFSLNRLGRDLRRPVDNSGVVVTESTGDTLD